MGMTACAPATRHSEGIASGGRAFSSTAAHVSDCLLHGSAACSSSSSSAPPSSPRPGGSSRSPISFPSSMSVQQGHGRPLDLILPRPGRLALAENRKQPCNYVWRVQKQQR
ncbi:hypothetical protein SEVIR_3G314603v4 [Setaria viridis]|uniref:Uncharacterized protein n=1 Tax=Setaria viridis TaxID=4556 RepID=A0A4U6VFR5_SETVI|nr:hypothetical protein SEVIR_3G314603v2 [Setaria viridis]